jgi:hypothetical protein
MCVDIFDDYWLMQLAEMFFYTRQEIVEENAFYIHSNVFVTIFTERTRCCIVEGVFITCVAFESLHACGLCWGIISCPSIFIFFLLAGSDTPRTDSLARPGQLVTIWNESLCAVGSLVGWWQ